MPRKAATTDRALRYKKRFATECTLLDDKQERLEPLYTVASPVA